MAIDDDVVRLCQDIARRIADLEAELDDLRSLRRRLDGGVGPEPATAAAVVVSGEVASAEVAATWRLRGYAEVAHARRRRS